MMTSALCIPLFPLPMVFYPDGLLGLKIFEIRYLDMIKNCLADDIPFGIICLTQAQKIGNPDKQEIFSLVGTLASIVNHQSVGPGLIKIQCLGTQRFTILDCQKGRYGLWSGEVKPISSDLKIPIPDELSFISQALSNILISLPQDNQKFCAIRAPYDLDDCGWVANRWCELLPLGIEAKQRMLELDSPLLRLELIGDQLDKYR